MFLQYIGINEKALNLNSVALIEDVSTDKETVAKVTTVSGDEFELTGTDADVLFARVDLLIKATDHAITQFTTPQTANA